MAACAGRERADVRVADRVGDRPHARALLGSAADSEQEALSRLLLCLLHAFA
jgi:hypothetical protein